MFLGVPRCVHANPVLLKEKGRVIGGEEACECRNQLSDTQQFGVPCAFLPFPRCVPSYVRQHVVGLRGRCHVHSRGHRIGYGGLLRCGGVKVGMRGAIRGLVAPNKGRRFAPAHVIRRHRSRWLRWLVVFLTQNPSLWIFVFSLARCFCLARQAGAHRAAHPPPQGFPHSGDDGVGGCVSSLACGCSGVGGGQGYLRQRYGE